MDNPPRRDAAPLPRVFIGSSTEHLLTARALKECMAPYARAVVWDEHPFDLNESTFGGLLTATDQFDFAVFLFEGDDLTRIRNATGPSVRDNVLFEFGLFVGRIGRGRAFWMSPGGAQAPRLPIDLAGLTHLEYVPPAEPDPDGTRAALTRACARLRAQMDALGPRTDRAIEVLESVRILCAASSQYAQPKFAHDIETIQGNFPAGSVVSAHGVSARHLFDYLMDDAGWDLIHLAMYVDPATGELLVPDAAPGAAVSAKDRIPAEGVAGLIASARPRLVVIVTCDSLALATRVARLTNTIAGYQPIEARAALDWSTVFYKFLARGTPLTEAFNRAQSLTDPGLLLLAKRDFRLALPPPSGTAP